MKRFILEQSKTEFYTSHSGLALIGQFINRFTSLGKTNRTIKKRHGIPNIELLRSFLGLLCLGKSDYDTLENHRADTFFKQALGIKQMPSASRLRLRFDEDASHLMPIYFPWTTAKQKKKESPVPTNRLMVTVQWPAILVKKAGTSTVNCG